ncbi:hypothetical protein FOL47_004067, partial [Perkinsus chesapeaki]
MIWSVSATEDPCAQMCSYVEGCANSKYDSYCKSWQSPSVCFGLAKKADGSICFEPEDADCVGEPIACGEEPTAAPGSSTAEYTTEISGSSTVTAGSSTAESTTEMSGSTTVTAGSSTAESTTETSGSTSVTGGSSTTETSGSTTVIGSTPSQSSTISSAVPLTTSDSSSPADPTQLEVASTVDFLLTRLDNSVCHVIDIERWNVKIVENLKSSSYGDRILIGADYYFAPKDWTVPKCSLILIGPSLRVTPLRIRQLAGDQNAFSAALFFDEHVCAGNPLQDAKLPSQSIPCQRLLETWRHVSNAAMSAVANTTYRLASGVRRALMHDPVVPANVVSDGNCENFRKGHDYISPAQCHLDQYIRNIFSMKGGDSKARFFVDISVGDSPFQGSISFMLEKCQGWTGLCVLSGANPELEKRWDSFRAYRSCRVLDHSVAPVSRAVSEDRLISRMETDSRGAYRLGDLLQQADMTAPKTIEVLIVDVAASQNEVAIIAGINLADFDIKIIIVKLKQENSKGSPALGQTSLLCRGMLDELGSRDRLLLRANCLSPHTKLATANFVLVAGLRQRQLNSQFFVHFVIKMKFAIATAATISVAIAGQCTQEDHDFWTSYGQTYSNFLAGCGQKAWGDAKGTTKCLVEDPMNKLTPSCAQCFGDSVECGRGSCMFSCIAGPATSKCLKCIHGSDCDDKLYACTGYPANEMPPDPTGEVKTLPVTTAAPTTTTTTTTTPTTTTTTTTTTTPTTTTTTTTTTPTTTTTTTTAPTTTTSTTTTPTTTTTTTTAPTTTTTTTTPTTTSTSTTAAPTTTTATSPLPEDKCSTSDHDLWASYGQAYSNFIAYCGLQSFGDAKATTTCIEQSGLSDSCSACFGQSVQCGRDVCMMSCIAGPATDKCLNCIAKTECNPDLYKCTGYDASQMPPNPT